MRNKRSLSYLLTSKPLRVRALRNLVDRRRKQGRLLELSASQVLYKYGRKGEAPAFRLRFPSLAFKAKAKLACRLWRIGTSRCLGTVLLKVLVSLLRLQIVDPLFTVLQLPIVTRFYVTASFVITAACSLDVSRDDATGLFHRQEPSDQHRW